MLFKETICLKILGLEKALKSNIASLDCTLSWLG